MTVVLIPRLNLHWQLVTRAFQKSAMDFNLQLLTLKMKLWSGNMYDLTSVSYFDYPDPVQSSC